MSQFNFNNTYEKLPQIFYNFEQPHPALNPQILIYNQNLANELGLSDLTQQEATKIFSLNKILQNASYIAQAYAGHQFGHFNILGDGRALLIGEQIAPNGKKFDISLKGSGRTKYSRNGDGLAAISPMMREFLISEAMHFLNISSTRSLCVLKSDEEVYRQKIDQGAILVRVAKSHIRFGTFEFAAFKGENYVKTLADYSISRHFEFIKDDEFKYINFFKTVLGLQAKLVASWQAVGFIHGVLNTDNMLVCAQTIDFGPCAFMDILNPNQVFSSIDTKGRYSYKNQPDIVFWNLCRFAQSLLSLCSKEQLLNELSSFNKLYKEAWLEKMGAKFGITSLDENDEKLINEFLSLVQNFGEDFTNAFLKLTYLDKNIPLHSQMFKSSQFKSWSETYKNRLNRCDQKLMQKSNPVIIPRNHQVEEVLLACENEDLKPFSKFLQVLQNPFEFSDLHQNYLLNSLKLNPLHKTFCGT